MNDTHGWTDATHIAPTHSTRDTDTQQNNNVFFSIYRSVVVVNIWINLSAARAMNTSSLVVCIECIEFRFNSLQNVVRNICSKVIGSIHRLLPTRMRSINSLICRVFKPLHCWWPATQCSFVVKKAKNTNDKHNVRCHCDAEFMDPVE